jgi:bifunctional DNase/RNase
MTAYAIQALGGQVGEVRIDRLSDTTFYATLVLDGPSGPAEVDARPSDALCLALTVGAPIRADRAMVDEVLAPSPAPATQERCGRGKRFAGRERSSMS